MGKKDDSHITKFGMVTISGSKNDGGQQSQGHATATNRRQNDLVRGQGRGRQDIVRGVLQRGREHRHPQEDGGGRLGPQPSL